MAAVAAAGDDYVVENYVVEDYAIPAPLTAAPGDPERGRAIVVERQPANCLSCHAVPVEAEFFGTTGPTLAAVGRRLTPGQLRLRLVDPKRINPLTIMPAYYKTAGLHRVARDFVGQPLLTAQDIEDVIAFLATLQ